VLADVSGKGLPAAMIVSDLHAAIRLLSPLSRSPETLIGSLAEHLRSSLPGNKFVTLFAARVAADGPWIDYVVAGHPAPFLVAPDGRLSRLEPGGPVLGVMPGRWTRHRVEMTPGSLLVAFTDGYSEAASPAGDELGEAAVGELVAGSAEYPLAEISSRLAAAADALRDGAPAQDDATLLLVRRTSGGET
jgi:sigma-B regulation protein RsbU (phosphoserine phosphatase)